MSAVYSTARPARKRRESPVSALPWKNNVLLTQKVRLEAAHIPDEALQCNQTWAHLFRLTIDQPFGHTNRTPSS